MSSVAAVHAARRVLFAWRRGSREYYTSDEDRLEAMCSDSGSSCSGNGSDSEDGKWAPCLGSAAERLARRPCARESSGGAPQVTRNIAVPIVLPVVSQR